MYMPIFGSLDQYRAFRRRYREEKVRTGFGTWATVWVAECENGHLLRLLGRRGGFPPGAVRCDCGALVHLSDFGVNFVPREKRK